MGPRGGGYSIRDILQSGEAARFSTRTQFRSTRDIVTVQACIQSTKEALNPCANGNQYQTPDSTTSGSLIICVLMSIQFEMLYTYALVTLPYAIQRILGNSLIHTPSYSFGKRSSRQKLGTHSMQ